MHNSTGGTGITGFAFRVNSLVFESKIVLGKYFLDTKQMGPKIEF